MATRTARVRTDTLMRRIFKADTLDELLRQNAPSMQAEPFSAHLAALCAQRGLVPERVIRRAEIDRSYGHQLFNGTRQPSRDKVLQLALGMGLSVDEAQRLLRAADRSPLYPRIKRDAVVLFALGKSLGVNEVQALLVQHGLTPLGGVNRHDE